MIELIDNFPFTKARQEELQKKLDKELDDLVKEL